MEKLLNVIYSNTLENWSERRKEAFNESFGAASWTLPRKSSKRGNTSSTYRSHPMILIFEITICDFNSMQPDGN
jgi:hypothetical protein